MTKDQDQDFYMDLQLLAGEKTEQATPKKRQEARKRGQVLRSNEVNSALILLCVFFVLKIYFPFMWATMQEFTSSFLLEELGTELTIEGIQLLFLKALVIISKLTLPIAGVALLAGLLANYLQIGFLFSTEVLQIKLERINPIEGFRRIFSKRAIVELIKSVWKIVAVSYIAYLTIREHFYFFPQLMDLELAGILYFIYQLVCSLTWRVGLLLLILAGLDYLYQWWEYEHSLRMSKQEVKDEYKQMEGDPLIKAQIRQKQRAVAMQRMMSEVPKADVVITNPTHFAVALKYEVEQMEAPVVVAKGQDYIAQRIKALAQAHEVVIVENPPLAQGLYRSVEIGQVIPETLYQAVAEVLAFVYQLKHQLN